MATNKKNIGTGKHIQNLVHKIDISPKNSIVGYDKCILRQLVINKC